MQVVKPLWKRILRLVTTVLYFLIIGLVLFYALVTKLNPVLAGEIFPVHFYTVVTDSMVPTIPVHSMVAVKSTKEEDLEVGKIITFHAERFSENILLTHYLDEIEDYEGAPRYRTRAEGVDHQDDYVTRYEDIVGTYLFHVPGLGKISLFLTSSAGITMLFIILLVLIIQTILRSKMEKEGFLNGRGVVFKSLKVERETACFRGRFKNSTAEDTICLLQVELCLYDKDGNRLLQQEQELLQDVLDENGQVTPLEQLLPKQQVQFMIPIAQKIINQVATYELEVQQIKLSCSEFVLTNQTKSQKRKVQTRLEEVEQNKKLLQNQKETTEE